MAGSMAGDSADLSAALMPPTSRSPIVRALASIAHAVTARETLPTRPSLSASDTINRYWPGSTASMPVSTAVPGSPAFSISVFSAVAGDTPRPCRFTSAMPVV